MSKKYPCVPKGAAMALHLTEEYAQGQQARLAEIPNRDNPYNFWNEYIKHYAWDIGWQSPPK